MTFQEHLEILVRLIEKLSVRGCYLKLSDLVKEINLSERQIQRYITEIRNLGFELTYCKKHKGYQIDKEKSTLLPATKQFLEAFKVYQISQQNKISNYIIFDKRQEVDTIFKDLHDAIVKRFLVEITYQSFWQEEAFTTEIEPYLLKEYRNRWYVVAKNYYNQKIRTFALDRIQQLRLTAKNFTYPQENPAELFKYCFGIFLPENPLEEPEEVLLLFSYEQAPYVQSLPLHHSQKVVGDTGEGILISLKVHYTYDLNMELLSFGDEVKVIATDNYKNL
jgi:predicted DNA-binding transcriptional regulator YafY